MTLCVTIIIIIASFGKDSTSNKPFLSVTKFDVTDFRQEWYQEYQSCSSRIQTYDYKTQFMINGQVIDEREVAITNAIFIKGSKCIGYTKSDGKIVLWLE